MLEEQSDDPATAAVAIKHRQALEEALETEDCDFSDPYFWAPFVLVGLGGQPISKVSCPGIRADTFLE
jgi:CHAT domain-containing protein